MNIIIKTVEGRGSNCLFRFQKTELGIATCLILLLYLLLIISGISRKKSLRDFFSSKKKIQNFCIYGKFSLSKTILLLILAYFSYKKENPPRVRNSKKRRKQFFSREISL